MSQKAFSLLLPLTAQYWRYIFTRLMPSALHSVLCGSICLTPRCYLRTYLCIWQAACKLVYVMSRSLCLCSGLYQQTVAVCALAGQQHAYAETPVTCKMLRTSCSFGRSLCQTCLHFVPNAGVLPARSVAAATACQLRPDETAVQG